MKSQITTTVFRVLLRFTGNFSLPAYGALWLGMMFVLAPLSIFLRFQNLGNTLVDLHPWRQAQTALPILQYMEDGIQLFDYTSAMNGVFWKFFFEFPLYHASVAIFMKLTGLNIEIASRLVCLISFVGVLIIFTAIFRRCFSVEVALWGFALMLITPFSVIYSRACLIDMQAVFVLGLAIWSLVNLKESNGRWSSFWAVAFFSFGALLSVVKVQLWYVPAFVLGIVTLHGILKREISWRFGVAILCLLVAQLPVAVSWIEWTKYVRGGGTLADWRGWFVGDLAQRFDLQVYWKAYGPLFRQVLHDWAVIPFAFGMFRAKKLEFSLLAIVIIPPYVLFNVFQKHDYYWVGQLPWVVGLAALGMQKLARAQRSVIPAMLTAVVGIVFCYRSAKIAYNYGPLFHTFSDDVADAVALGSRSASTDIIFTANREGDLYLPIYANRKVATWGYTNLAQLRPQLIVPAHNWPLDGLSIFSEIQVERFGNDIIFRTDDFALSRAKVNHMIRVSDSAVRLGVKAQWNVPIDLNTCQMGSHSIQAPGEKGQLFIVADGQRWELPVRKSLTIPPQFADTCRVQVVFQS